MIEFNVQNHMEEITITCLLDVTHLIYFRQEWKGSWGDFQQVIAKSLLGSLSASGGIVF